MTKVFNNYCLHSCFFLDQNVANVKNFADSPDIFTASHCYHGDKRNSPGNRRMYLFKMTDTVTLTMGHDDC